MQLLQRECGRLFPSMSSNQHPESTRPVVIVPGSDSENNSRAEDESSATWWHQYQTALENRRVLSTPAINEIGRISQQIANRLHDPNGQWQRPVRGAVVGAVQSGKTGILAGVAARAMDRGYRVIVILAGLKDDLRTQTARRLIRDVLWRGDQVYSWINRSWQPSEPPVYDHPLGKGLHGALKSCWSLHYRDDVNQDDSFRSRLVRKLSIGKNVLVVAKKNVRSLERLHEALDHASEILGGDLMPMLVIDDECDEASVGDDQEKPTPEFIERLVTASPKQISAYVGLTATIAANILQDPERTLFPEDFIEIARYPSNRETALTYEEPEHDKRYSGGGVFYHLFEEAGLPNFLVHDLITDEELKGEGGRREQLEEALIAYFVSGAIRLAAHPQKSLDDPDHLADPHSMLVHTDVTMDEHWAICEAILRIMGDGGGFDSEHLPIDIDVQKTSPDKRIIPLHLQRWYKREPDRWKAWHKRFLESTKTLHAVLPGSSRPGFPTWEETVLRLPLVFVSTKLRVINSDDSADPPLDYNAPQGANGREMPYDLFSIVIGGNRLSRGLTIEGLCISYYTRTSQTWAEDTAVQRERWFGYRGAHLEFCRVFLHPETALRFTRFNEHENDLRAQLAWILSEQRRPKETALRFMCLPDSTPTYQRARGQDFRLALSGSRIFVDWVQMGDKPKELEAARKNEGLAAQWWNRIRSDGTSRLGPNRRVLGWLLNDVPLDEVSALLDGFSYSFHNPDPRTSVAVSLRDFHREPSPNFDSSVSLRHLACPYFTAAYLRYWQQAFADAKAGAASGYRGEDGISAWRSCPPPTFNVGFRFGELPAGDEDRFQGANLLNRTVLPDGRVGSRWGGHGESGDYFGDEWFDTDPPSGDPTEPRRPGIRGLILIHVAHKDARGVKHRGTQYPFHRPFVGICLPGGGPCFRCVVTHQAGG